MSEQNVLADLGAETVLQTLKQSLPFPSNLRHGQRLVTWQFPSAPWTGTIASLGMPGPVTGTSPPPTPEKKRLAPLFHRSLLCCSKDWGAGIRAFIQQ